MISKGLSAIEEAVNAVERAAQAAWQKQHDEWVDECLRDSDDDTERFVWFGETTPDGDDHYVIYHVKDKKVIALAGIDQTLYKAWRDVPGYCAENGLNFDALYEASKK